MPRFEPFAGVRYHLAHGNGDHPDIDDVVAPPYDVIGDDAQDALEARSRYNVVRVDLLRAADGEDRYLAAGERFAGWLAQGVLRTDPEPGFYLYAMGYHDTDGRSRQIKGVLGALEVSRPAEGGEVLPHEETQSKVRDDRLSLLRACRADLSPVWGLSMASGLSELLSPPGPPVARCTDEEGVHHRLWRITQPGLLEAVTATVASAPVVIADGHHRYETALAYRDERRAAHPGRVGDEGLLLALVCELADVQDSVRPIHRVLAGLPGDLDMVDAMTASFEPVATDGPLASLADRMADAGTLALLLPGDRTVLLRPRPAAVGTPARSDAALLDDALATLASLAAAAGIDPTLSYDHSLPSVAAQVATGTAQAGFILRPVSVDHIAETARAGRRMPTKTTYFHPKPRTGMVFRSRAD